MKLYGKYGRKASRIEKRFGKYRRKLWKDMKNMENMEEKYLFYKTCNLFKLTLCSTVRGGGDSDTIVKDNDLNKSNTEQENEP